MTEMLRGHVLTMSWYERRRRVAAMATVRGGDKSDLLHERFPKLGAPFTVVLVCIVQGVGTYLLGEKLPTSTSTSNIVLIDVAPSTFTNGPK